MEVIGLKRWSVREGLLYIQVVVCAGGRLERFYCLFSKTSLIRTTIGPILSGPFIEVVGLELKYRCG